MTLCSTVWDLSKCRSCWITNRLPSISCRLIWKQSAVAFISKNIMYQQKRIGPSGSRWGIRSNLKQSPVTSMLIQDLVALWKLEMMLPETGQWAITQMIALIRRTRNSPSNRALLCWCHQPRPSKRLQGQIQIWANKWITRQKPRQNLKNSSEKLLLAKVQMLTVLKIRLLSLLINLQKHLHQTNQLKNKLKISLNKTKDRTWSNHQLAPFNNFQLRYQNIKILKRSL